MTGERSTDGGAGGRSPRTVLIGLGIGVAVALFLIPWIAAAWSGDDESQVSPASITLVDGISTDTPDDEFPPQDDLEPGATCTVDTGGLRAAGSVTNHTRQAASYRIEVEWENEGFVLATASSFLDRVEPQETAAFEVVSTNQGGTAASTCRVTTIDRSPVE